MDRAQGLAAFAFGEKPHAIALADLDQLGEPRLVHCLSAIKRAVGEETVGGDDLAFGVDDRG